MASAAVKSGEVASGGVRGGPSRWVIALAMVAVLAGAEVPVRGGEVATVRAGGPLVISGHPEATQAGLEILRHGGNAADAFVATSLALGVTEPGNSGLGGKLLVLYYDAATRQTTFVTALSAAPAKLDEKAAVEMPAWQRSRGWTAACVPALVAGLGAVHDRWGSRPLSELAGPAIRLATEGYVLSARSADMGAEFPLKVDNKPADPNAVAIYAPGGKHLKAGDRASNPDLGATLQGLAAGGWKSFYTGDTARKIVAAANAGGNPMTLDDFAACKAQVSPPLTFSYEGYTVFTGPAPSNGGAIIAGTMKVLEGRKWHAASSRETEFIDAFSRALIQVYAVSSRVAGDAPGSQADIEASLSAESVAQLRDRAEKLDPKLLGGQKPSNAPTEAAVPAEWLPPAAGAGMVAALEPTGDDSPESCTTHLFVMDAAGNMIVATQSLGLHFGSAVVAPGTGVLMNSDMYNFSYRSPGSINQVAAGRRPRSTMAPTLVLKDGKPVLAIGSPGGGRIPVQILQVLMDVLEFHRPLPEAVRARRFHLPRAATKQEAQNLVELEAGFDSKTGDELQARGWSVSRMPEGGYYFGSVNSAVFLPDGTIVGVADPRRSSDAAGLNPTD